MTRVLSYHRLTWCFFRTTVGRQRTGRLNSCVPAPNCPIPPKLTSTGTTLTDPLLEWDTFATRTSGYFGLDSPIEYVGVS